MSATETAPTPEETIELLTAERDVALASVTHWQAVAQENQRRSDDAHREYAALGARMTAQTDASIRSIADRLAATVRVLLDSDEHVVDVRETAFGLMHPFKCRPDLLGCPLNQALNALPTAPADPGRYFVTLDDGAVVVGDVVPEGYDPIRLTDLLTIIDRLGGTR
jgi:hypothetical protein